MNVVWSFAAIIASFLLGESVRFLVKSNISRRSPYFYYIGELISAFEFSASVFELAVIGKFYSSSLGFFCSFLLLCLKNTEYILDGLSANPCGLLERIVLGNSRKSRLVDFVIKVSSQLTGALLSFPFMKLVWQTTTSDMHFKQLSSGLSSTLDVPIAVGFAIEVTTTFLLTMMDFLTRGGLRSYNPYVRAVACVGICYVLTGTTGVWMNPVFATVHTFLFTRVNVGMLEHVLVFWAGPIFGTLVAISVDSKVTPRPTRRPIAKTILKKIKKQSSKRTCTSNRLVSNNGVKNRSNFTSKIYKQN